MIGNILDIFKQKVQNICKLIEIKAKKLNKSEERITFWMCL